MKNNLIIILLNVLFYLCKN